MRESSICLICLKPNDIWINFLSGFSSYDIYIIVDDNSKDYSKEYSINEEIKIVQISDKECKDSGYIKMSYLMIKKLVSGWDKSIYYFSKMNIGYKNVWFIEDDVFLHDERCLLEIDSKYKNSDLLSNIYSDLRYNDEDTNDWSSFIEEKLLIKYIHNRVGTPVRDLEINYVRLNDSRPRPFKKGELVIYQEKYNTYIILLFYNSDTSDTTQCSCYTKNSETNEYYKINNSKSAILTLPCGCGKTYTSFLISHFVIYL
jgi:hypothetical protein